MKAKELTPSQRRKLVLLLSIVRRDTSYSGCTSVRYDIEDHGRFVSVVIKSRRSDCGKYSLLQVNSAFYIHAMIGKKGRIVFGQVKCGNIDYTDYFCELTGGHKNV